jgi:hypothetical protein
MYFEEFNLLEGQQLPYPNRPSSTTPFGLAGALPYPAYDPGNPFAPTGSAFTLSAAPDFTVTSPMIPASMMTAVTTYGENIAAPYYGLAASPGAAYLATQPTPIVPGAQGRGDVREVLEPILLADLLLGF